MRRLVIAIAFVVPALTIGAQQPVFRAGIDVVTIDASVMDGGKPVQTLTKDDFRVTDDGVVQTLLDFGREQVPIDLTLTIDISGSITPGKRADIERAVRQVTDTLRADDRCSVVSFHSRVVEDTPLTHPPVKLNLAGQPDLGTSFMDALLLSLVTAPAVARRQLNLFLTDGLDTTSFFKAPLVLDTMKFASGQTSVILVHGPTNPWNDPGNRPVREMVEAVTTTSGGQIVDLYRDDALKDTFLTALDAFRTGYVLRYTPTGVPRPGWHPVVVTVGKKKYTVRARQGYWMR